MPITSNLTCTCWDPSDIIDLAVLQAIGFIGSPLAALLITLRLLSALALPFLVPITCVRWSCRACHVPPPIVIAPAIPPKPFLAPPYSSVPSTTPGKDLTQSGLRPTHPCIIPRRRPQYACPSSATASDSELLRNDASDFVLPTPVHYKSDPICPGTYLRPLEVFALVRGTSGVFESSPTSS